MSATLLLHHYVSKPGDVGALSKVFPEIGVPWPADNKDAMLVFLHPHCSCSRATLGELDHLLTAISGKVHLDIIFYKPEGEADTWVQTDNWRRAKAYSDTDVFVDEGGKIARVFGARTSGFVTLYDRNRHLVYAGGITPARGHMGDSRGQILILNHFSGQDLPAIQVGSVYGCSFESAKSLLAEIL